MAAGVHEARRIGAAAGSAVRGASSADVAEAAH